MSRIPYRKVPGKVVAGAALVALLGVGAANLTVEQVAEFEGYVPQAYQDPVGIWTKCWGDATDVTPGETYTFEQCLKSLNDHTVELARPVMRCIPDLKDQHDKTVASMVSMAYNIGPSAFCRSSVARYANAGDWARACKRMAEIYKTAKGQELPGLVKRRKLESELCMEGVREKALLEANSEPNWQRREVR